MPNASSTCYSISFHPLIEEWMSCKESFLTNFVKVYSKKAKYILTAEKGNQHYATHYQGFIEFAKEVRSDTIQKTFHNRILKGVEISNLKIALKLVPVTSHVKRCQGYTLKETSDDLNEVKVFNYDLSYMVEVKEFYLKYLAEKRMGKDKQRLNIRNLPEIVRTYRDLHYPTMDFSTSHKKNYLDSTRRKNMSFLISRMGLTDYYVLPIVIKKDFPQIVTYLIDYLSNSPTEMDKSIYRLCQIYEVERHPGEKYTPLI